MRRKAPAESSFDKFLRESVRSNRVARDRTRTSWAKEYETKLGRRVTGRTDARHGRPRGHLRLVSLLAILSFLIMGGSLWFSQNNSWSSTSYGPTGPRAALVDELSLSIPDPAFVTGATSTLQGAGYTVDYYPPTSVTVAFLRDLPQKDYSLIILRAHTGSRGPNLAVFTSEPYTQYKYVLEQLTDQVVPGVTQMTQYLAITPTFVRDQMHGGFKGSLIIMMGCRSLSGPEMAQAFLDKGAKAYVGWDNLVGASHTDTSTLALLQSLTQGKSLPDAIDSVANRLGPDPSYGSRLGYYDPTVRVGGELAAPLTALAALVAYTAIAITGITTVILIPKLFGRR